MWLEYEPLYVERRPLVHSRWGFCSTHGSCSSATPAHLRSRDRRHNAGCRCGVLRRESHRTRSDAVRRSDLRVVAAELHPDGCAGCNAAAAMACRAAGRTSRARAGAGANGVALVDGSVAVRDQLQRSRDRGRSIEDPQRRPDAIRHPSALRSVCLCSGPSRPAIVELCGRGRRLVAARGRLLDDLVETVAFECAHAADGDAGHRRGHGGGTSLVPQYPGMAARRGRVARGLSRRERVAGLRCTAWIRRHIAPHDRHRAGRAAATGPLGGAAVRPGRHESRAPGDNAGCRMGPRARESDCGADFGGPADPQRSHHPHSDRGHAAGTCDAHRRAPAIDACARRTVPVREAAVRVLARVRPGAERKDERGVPRVAPASRHVPRCRMRAPVSGRGARNRHRAGLGMASARIWPFAAADRSARLSMDMRTDLCAQHCRDIQRYERFRPRPRSIARRSRRTATRRCLCCRCSQANG